MTCPLPSTGPYCRPCPESQEQCFNLALGMVSSWAAVSIWHWSKESLVTTRAGTGKGMAGESHGMGQQAEDCPLISSVLHWH